MLGAAERAAVADRFGVSGEQIERDYLLSLVLAVLAREAADDVVFFGDTALARTHLPEGRLSEDLDLIAVGSRREVAARLDRVLPRAVQREYGRLTWRPPLSAVRDTVLANLLTADGLAIRVQLLSASGYPSWPTEARALHQRYRDAPPARLRVPTRPAFVAGKMAAWCDRAAPRDLWDLWALAGIGAIDAETAALFREYGPTATVPQPWMFAEAPSQARWEAQLAGQTRLEVSAAEALESVRDAWSHAVNDG